MIRGWLIDVARWMLRVLQAPLPRPINVLSAPPEILPYREEAARLSSAVDASRESGEWKRHQVYAAMLKKFPDAPRRALALAIEWGLRPPQED